MTIDNLYGTGVIKSQICDPLEETNACSSTGGLPRASAGKVIDFRARASEIRVKGAESETVSSFEATKALAFGMMYLKGEGVERDPSKAAQFLATAAKGGSSKARHELAILHLDGPGVPYDPAYARKLLQLASDDGHLDSTVYLGQLFIFGKHCTKKIEEGLELLYVAAGKSEPNAMYYLAVVYDREPDYRNSFEAAYWYRRAAEFGHFKSQLRLASLYAMGQGVPRCLETAEAFLQVALATVHEQDPEFLLWQGEYYMKRPETEFVAEALIKAAADMRYTPARRVMLQRGWRA